jgi:hypothetical protein
MILHEVMMLQGNSSSLVKDHLHAANIDELAMSD